MNDKYKRKIYEIVKDNPGISSSGVMLKLRSIKKARDRSLRNIPSTQELGKLLQSDPRIRSERGDDPRYPYNKAKNYYARE